MTFEETYPNRPPSVKFVSKMFHPNVYNNGELCLDILQNRWSPTYDVMAILTSVQSLLNDPNPGRWVSLLQREGSWLNRARSPANAEAAQLFRDNMKEYIRRVRVSCVCPMLLSPADHLLSSIVMTSTADRGRVLGRRRGSGRDRRDGETR